MTSVGIYRNLPEVDYHQGPGLSQSMLKRLREEGGPAKARFGERITTRAQKFGTLVHTALLQPHLMDRHFRVTNLETVGTKAWQAEEVAAMGRELVKKADYDRAMAICEAVRRWSSVARELLEPGDIVVEQSFYWTDTETGLLCRGRADVWNARYGVLIDLKSTVDASQDGFRHAVRQYGYHLQGAHYIDGWTAVASRPEEFILLPVEKTPPHLCAAYALDASDIQAGRDEMRALKATWLHCEQTGDWPGYDPGLQTLSLNR